MRDETKIKYLRIIRAYEGALAYFGPNAPYVSKNRIIDFTISELIKEGISSSRIGIYRALRKVQELKGEQYMLG